MSARTNEKAPPKTAEHKTRKAGFDWSDPLLLDEQLTDEERLIRDSTRDYAQEKLQTRVLMANREERFDREIMNEMGEPRNYVSSFTLPLWCGRRFNLRGLRAVTGVL